VADQSGPPVLFHVSYLPLNGFKWFGDGDLLFADQSIRFTAQRSRPFWFPKLTHQEFPLNSIADVELLDTQVRLKVQTPDEEPRTLVLRAVNPAQAKEITHRLPSIKSASFVPVLAERAAFESALRLVTPHTPVTFTLIAANLLMFAVATVLGGGLIKTNPEVMIGLGTDYTPLTFGGQWWRLLSSIFLHFGLLHVAFNMWALYINGIIAERIFGNLRFLFIYLVAGLAGSITSLLWHPIVNGAGASGAIFGVLGALIAFYVKKERGIPASVIKAQLTISGIFVIYSLLNAARYQGIDNAAHIGGLVAGFAMGFVLARPLEADRNTKSWTLQWATAFGLTGVAIAILFHLIVTGGLVPRLAHDNHGHPIPLAGLSPPIRALGGFKLGMTSAEILKAKGVPLVQEKTAWVYNSIDSTHDAVLTVFFASNNQSDVGPVYAIEFTGRDRGSAPPEIPYLNALNSSEIISKYGEPTSRTKQEATEFLWFRNGVYVGLHNDRIYRYGIFNLAAQRD
jgi:membrane associated rhomboid family serine protease